MLVLDALFDHFQQISSNVEIISDDIDRSPRRWSAAEIGTDAGGRERNSRELRLAIRLANATCRSDRSCNHNRPFRDRDHIVRSQLLACCSCAKRRGFPAT
jgi:hypothetical protein